MCQGYSEIYQGCSHLKGLVITAPCNDGANEQGQCSGDNLDITSERYISLPSLCMGCRQHEERVIYDGYEHEVRTLETMIEDLRWNRRAEPEAEVRTDMREEMTRLEEMLGDARDERSEILHDFRLRQGVRADG